MIRSLASRVLFVALFIVPFAAFLVFELAVISDRYESEASIIIGQEQSGNTSFNISFLGLPTAGNNTDAQAIVEFIGSRDMLRHLDDTYHLRAHYSSKRVDWWDRLAPTASFEELYLYMPNWLTVAYDTTAKIIRVQFQAFDENYSRMVLDAIISRSQVFVDGMNAKMSAEQTRFFEEKMAETDARLKRAKQELLTFQRANKLLTTESESAFVMNNIAALQRFLIATQAAVDVASKTLSDKAPRLQELKNTAAALARQIKKEKDRLSGGSTSAISELDAQERDIQLNLESVLTMYQSNLSQLEQARIEAARRVKFLVTVASPVVPDEARLPDRFLGSVIAGVVLLAFYFIIAISVAIIREHA